ncbi:MAG: SRPBCC family protein [Phormidesmis sp.]
MEIQQEFSINASCDHVWDILGNQYAQVDNWASSVYASHQHSFGSILPDAPCAGRICETSLGKFQETITHYDEQRRQVAYTAIGEKIPFFVKHLTNHWTVNAFENQTATVTMCLKVSILPIFNVVMGPIMRRQMEATVKTVVEDLIYFAETDTPHPRKGDIQHRLKVA